MTIINGILGAAAAGLLGMGALGCGDSQYNVDMEGTAMFCVRPDSEYSGMTDLGIAVDVNLHITHTGGGHLSEWAEIRKVGVRAYGDSVTEFHPVAFSGEWAKDRVHYTNLSPHNLAVGQVDDVVLYIINDAGDDMEFGLEEVDCGTLDEVVRGL